MSSTLGTAIGPFLAIWMMLHVGYNAIFILSSVVALCCLIVSLYVRVPNIPHSSQSLDNQVPVAKASLISEYIEKNAIPISLIMLFASIFYSGVLSFINFYAKEIDLVQAASFFFLMYAIAILVSRPITGPLMDRKGENIIMYPAFVIMAIAFFLLSITQSATMLLICAGLLGLGYGNIQSICQTVAVKSTSLERMGFATSTYFIFLDAGLGFGPYFLGMTLDFISYQQLYLYSAIGSFACIGLYYVLHGRHKDEVHSIAV